MVNRARDDRQTREAAATITADAAYAGQILSGAQAMEPTSVAPTSRPSTPAI